MSVEEALKATNKDCREEKHKQERLRHVKDYRALYGKVSKSRWFREAYEGKSVGEAMRKE